MLLSIASSINISSFTNQTYQRRKILKLNGKFTNLEAQLTLHLTCTGAIKMTSITPKNLTPKNRKFKQSKNPIQDQLNPPKYSRISALRQYIKVNPPLWIATQLLPDQEQSHTHPRLQPTADASYLWFRHRIGIDPESLWYLQDDLVSAKVSLGDKSQTLRDGCRLHWGLGGDHAFTKEPIPEGLDGRRRRLGSGLEWRKGLAPAGGE